MTNDILINQTLLGLYYLVFETRQTINIRKSNISWLQKLYLDKAISHFGTDKLNINKNGNSYTLIINNLEDIIKQSKILDRAKINNKKCLKTMKEYAKVTNKITRKKYKKLLKKGNDKSTLLGRILIKVTMKMDKMIQI